MKYDPTQPQDPKQWGALSEQERVKAAEEAHLPPPDGHPPIDNSRVHAALHAVVETQVAAGQPPEARRALDRLMAEGLTRHDALHAVGTVASEFLLQVLQRGQRFDAEAYAKGLRALSAQAVRRATVKHQREVQEE